MRVTPVTATTNYRDRKKRHGQYWKYKLNESRDYCFYTTMDRYYHISDNSDIAKRLRYERCQRLGVQK